MRRLKKLSLIDNFVISEHIAGPCAVKLHSPIPFDIPMEIYLNLGEAALVQGGLQ